MTFFTVLCKIYYESMQKKGFFMNFTILEARSFITNSTTLTNRVVKDYEIDMECSSDRVYSCNSTKKHRLAYGDILVRKPHDVVSATGAQNSYILTIDFSGTINKEMYSRNIQGQFQAMCREEPVMRLEPIIHPTNVNEVMGIYRKLISLADKNSSIAKELVHQLIYTLNVEISKNKYKMLKSSETISETVIAYMQENLNSNITLEEIARMVHLEKSYLVRLFRKETGKTPIDALIEMRLTKASDLIATTDLSIYDIATQCGYNTVSFFISMYKKRYGMTPEVHRRRINGN